MTSLCNILLAILAASPVQIWSTAELKSSADGLPSGAMEGKTLAGVATLWRRTKSGEAELHRTKTDLIVIEQGSATLVSGGTIPDAHGSQLSEIRGSAIRGGESKKVNPGDIIRIPAGTPHQFLLDPGQTVVYFALKIESKK